MFVSGKRSRFKFVAGVIISFLLGLIVVVVAVPPFFKGLPAQNIVPTAPYIISDMHLQQLNEEFQKIQSSPNIAYIPKTLEDLTSEFKEASLIASKSVRKPLSFQELSIEIQEAQSHK